MALTVGLRNESNADDRKRPSSELDVFLAEHPAWLRARNPDAVPVDLTLKGSWVALVCAGRVLVRLVPSSSGGIESVDNRHQDSTAARDEVGQTLRQGGVQLTDGVCFRGHSHGRG